MKDKVVIVTGASSGIGEALSQKLAVKGAKIVIAARNTEKINSIAETINKSGNCLAVTVDVTLEEDCKKLIETTIEKFGRIDVIINNAGISMRAIFHETDLKVLHTLMDVNFWGTVNCTKYALPHLLSSKGSLVGVSSIAGYKGLPGRTGYSASKFAMQGFLEVIRLEYFKKGLHVLIACPGFTASNIRKTALNKDGIAQGETPRDESKMMSPEVVAEKIIHAIEKRKRTIIMSTDGKLTVFLNKFFPKWVDKMVYNHIAKEPDSPFI